MSPVPLLDLRAQYGALRGEILPAVEELFETQSFILGPAVERFERDAAAFLGCSHAVGCASGTDALILSLAALGVGPGDEVLTTPFSFFATASCAYKVGARPRFSDVEPGTLNLDAGKVEAAIGPRTRALLPVHLFGQCADMDPLLEIGAKHRLPVVEDACQALGARYRSDRPGVGTRRAGAMGDTGCFSFFPSKNLGGFGDGGLVTTQDADLASRLRALRVHGERERYHHRWVGWNSRLDAVQAVVLGVKLPHLDSWSAARAANAERYDRLLSEVGLVAAGRVTLPARAPKAVHIFNQYTLRVEDRDRLGARLREQGIGWAIYYPIPLHLQECFRELGYREGDFPVAEAAAREVISLPVYPELTAEQQEEVVAAIAEFYRGGGPHGG